MRRLPMLLVLGSVLWLLAACGAARSTPTPPAGGEAAGGVLHIVTHDSFAIGSEVIAAFEAQSGASVVLVPLGDVGSMVNQSILSKNNPLGDLLFGVDNTFLSRALDAALFVPYQSPNLAAVPEDFQLDAEQRVTPIDFGDVCLNYDVAYFEEAAIAPPTSLEALIEPDYRDLTVVQNPATSSPGLAFLLATVVRFGESGWQGYWEQLRDNGVLVTAGWEDAYYGQFSGGSGEGERPIVVSYASSPPAEVFYAEEPPASAPTAAVTSAGSCFRQVEFAGVLANAEDPELAQAFIDFMLTPPFQEDIPLQMFVFPVVEGTALPAVFVEHAVVAEQPAQLDMAQIEAQRETLVQQWTALMTP